MFDPVDEEVKASIDHVHKATIDDKQATAGAKVAARKQAKTQRKGFQPGTNPGSSLEEQSTQKTELLRELRSDSTTPAEQYVTQDVPGPYQDFTQEALTSCLADLEAQLTAAKAIDWDVMIQLAQSARTLRDQPSFKNWHHGKKVQVQRDLNEQFDKRMREIKLQKKDHVVATQLLEDTMEELTAFMAQRKAGSQSPGTRAAAPKDADTSRLKALEQIKRRKEELLQKKDILAVKIARLKSSEGNLIEAPHSKQNPTSTSPTDDTDAQRPPDLIESSTPTPPQEPALDPLDAKSLRLYLPPNKKLKIDKSLTIDLGTANPKNSITDLRPHIESLNRQIRAMQTRLRAFHPPLDKIPLDITLKGSNRDSKQSLWQHRMWLKVLVARYQAKTGVYGELVDAKKKSWAGELSDEATLRMAKRREEILRKRGVAKEGGAAEQVRERGDTKRHEVQEVEEKDLDEEDHDEMGFLGGGLGATPPKRPKIRKLGARSTKPPHLRHYSTSARPPPASLNAQLADKEFRAQDPKPSSPLPSPSAQTTPHLPHLTSSGSAHMVSISSKSSTPRTAIAVGTVYFSNPTPLSLITANALKKGDVLGVSRVAGIMAAKKCPEIVPLCHPISLTHVGVELRTFNPSPPTATDTAATTPHASSVPAPPTSADDLAHGGVQIECVVSCTGATGVEMEALTAVMGTALSVVDMCKAVDKYQRIGDVRVVLKEGGKSGVWREEGWRSWQG